MKWILALMSFLLVLESVSSASDLNEDSRKRKFLDKSLKDSETETASTLVSESEKKTRETLLKKKINYYKHEFESWKRNGYIVEEAGKPLLNKKGTMRVFKFTSTGTKTLREAFKLLQGYSNIFPETGHTVFKLPIGGEIIEFRLSKFRGQILFYDAKGKLPKYDLSSLNNLNSKQHIAEVILDSLDSKLSEQPIFTDEFNFLGNNLKEVIDNTVNFMLGSQIAEAAHPYVDNPHYNEIIKVFLNGEVNADSIKVVPKSGRTPGSDVLTREKLKKISQGESGYGFDEKTFAFAQKGGAEKERKEVLKWRRETSEKVNRAQLYISHKEQINNMEREIKQKFQRSHCNNGRRKRSTCSFSEMKYNIEVVESSVKFEKNVLKFRYIDHMKSNAEIPIEVHIDKDQLIYNRAIEKHLQEINPEELSKFNNGGTLRKVSSALGVYGLVAGIAATGREFKEGNYGTGSLFLAQSLQQVASVSLTGLDKMASSLGKIVERNGLKAIASEVGMAQTFLKSSVARFEAAAPFVGLAFDIGFIGLDIKDLINTNFSNSEELTYVPLKVLHLYLDVGIAALNVIALVQPELAPIIEPIVIAITIVRMAVDDIYIDILAEMKQVNWRSWRALYQAPLHLIIGFEKGVADFATGGLIREIESLRKEHAENQRFLQNLSNVENYFEIHGEGDGRQVIDFTNGPMSMFAGSIDFHLYDNHTAHLCLIGTDMSGLESSKCNKFRVPRNTKDIVLGVGESRDFHFKTKKAKLWWFIPIYSEKVICGERLDKETLHGSYTGNSDDNRFFAVQDIPDTKKADSDECAYGKIDLHFTVKHYHYDILGGGGKDSFFLGPQSFHVKGGLGSDMYILSGEESSVVVNNFASDQKRDLMFMKSNFVDVQCTRNFEDLQITNGNHFVTIKKWFSAGNSNMYRHLLFKSKDGVIFSPEDKGFGLHKRNYVEIKHEVDCQAVFEDQSDADHGQKIDLRSDPFKSVIQIMGSKYDDSIFGNNKANLINGNSGNDFLAGEQGQDTYIINKEQSLMINNFAVDNVTDFVIISASFTSINAKRLWSGLVITAPTIHLTLVGWFSAASNRHAIFISSDHVTFEVHESSDGRVNLVPSILDYGETASRVTVDLMAHVSQGLPRHVLQSIVSVVDSRHSDVIKGNHIGNFLSCSGGNDYLQGNGGSDKYVIKENCSDVIINNYDDKETQDILLIKRKFHELTIYRDGLNLVITNIRKQLRQARVILASWFSGSKHQHLMLQSADGVAAMLPKHEHEIREVQQVRSWWFWKATTPTFLSAIGVKPPFIYYPKIIQLTQDLEQCKTKSFTNIKVLPLLDLDQEDIFKETLKVDFKSSNCIYSIKGNSLDNHLNPGPSPKTSKIPQYIEGGNGSDIYDLKGAFVMVNINNSALDSVVDKIILELDFHDIIVNFESGNVTIKDIHSQRLLVNILNYGQSEIFRHIQVFSADGYIFKPVTKDPFVEIIAVDQSDVTHSCNISLIGKKAVNARTIHGAMNAENMIQGNERNNVIYGGVDEDLVDGRDGNNWIETYAGDDTVYTGSGSDSILTGDGNDTVESGYGDDVICPGSGADTVNGGFGSDTIILNGDVSKKEGVIVNLTRGIGLGGDAEGDLYFFIDNIMGSQFDDILVGDRFENNINGLGGDDVIVPYNGDDVLSGGEGSDMYVLRDATGLKLINNFDPACETDFLVVDDKTIDNMCILKLNHDLHINFENSSWGKSLGVNFQNWFVNETYRHVNFSFQDGDLTEITGEDDMTDLMKENLLGNISIIIFRSKNTSVFVEWKVENFQYVITQCPNCTYYIKLNALSYPGNATELEEYDWEIKFDIDVNVALSGGMNVTGLFADVEYNIELLMAKCGVVLSRSVGESVNSVR